MTTPAPLNTPREYIFRTGDDELVRLGFQHRVWAASAYALWERAGFTRGWRVLDLGCGPGCATVDLAHLVGPDGGVVAADESERFLEQVRRRMEVEPLNNVETVRCDARELSLPAESLDGAYARWLLCFLDDPARAVAAVASALKPGGVFAIQDYSDYLGVRVSPDSAAFRRGFECIDAGWRAHGGDPDIGHKLPEMLAEAGFEARDIRPLVRTGRPGSPAWWWPTIFFRNFLPILEEEGFMTAQERADFEREWTARTNDPSSVFSTPPMVDIVAVKRA